MARLLYTLTHYLLLPVLLLRIVIRERQSPGYGKRWWERLGWSPRIPGDEAPIWLHAVSVGETIAAKPLVDALRARYPQVPILVTGMTATGAERVTTLLGDKVVHSFAPYDTPDIVSRFLMRVKPRALLIMETELWPNWVAGCRRRDIPVLLLNGRMSEKSAKGYARVRALSRPLFSSLSWVAAQTDPDARRFADLGVRREALSVSGSIKFDAPLPPQIQENAKAWRTEYCPGRLIWVAGSSHEGEEALLLAVHQQLLAVFPDLLLILVPRHPERFSPVAELVKASGLSFVRRSGGDVTLAGVQVLVGDTMGELLFFYAVGDIAFVGGSLIPRGGHNPLEPAALGKPVLMGRHVFNFQVICDELAAEEALVLVDREQVHACVLGWLSQPEERLRRGEQGRRCMERNRGALQRLLVGIDQRLGLSRR